MPRRYAVREKDPDNWTVYDIFTGWPAKVLGRRLTEFDAWEAKELAELLNLQDLTRRGKAGISGPWLYSSRRSPGAPT